MNITESSEVNYLIDLAIKEDIVDVDLTSDIFITDAQIALAKIKANEDCVIAGLVLIEMILRKLGNSFDISLYSDDGDMISRGDIVLSIKGNAKNLLQGERVILNFLQRMSGIATVTKQYCNLIKGTNARICDTRKTVPGLRILDKYAVKIGGGKNHRMNLSDGILIKDNHLFLLKQSGENLRKKLDEILHSVSPDVLVEVEVSSIKEFLLVKDTGVKVIMLDNMSLRDIREIVKLNKNQILLEASGGINKENVRCIAETGVNLISIGALTHSVKAIDLSCDMQFISD